MMAHVTYTSVMTLATAAGRIAEPPPSTSSASTPTSTTRSAGPAHHPVHHRRQGRPVPPAGASRTTPTPTCTWSTAARRRGDPRRQAPHHRCVAGPRADDHPDQGDEARRGGLRHRRHDPGQRPRREDHQHQLRAPPRRTCATSRSRARPLPRGLRHLRRRVRAQRADLPRRRGGPRRASFAHSLGPVGAPRRARRHGRRRRRAGRPGPAHRRGQRPRRRGPHQGEDLRDDHPRHRGPGLPRGRAVPRQDRRVRRRLPRRALHQRRQVHRRGQLQPDGPPPARHRRRRGGHRARRIADLENPETGHLVRKYMAHRAGVDGEYRTRLFHAIRDLTADSYGGWSRSPTSRPAAASTPSGS